jgi:signal transduction histidine kinase
MVGKTDYDFLSRRTIEIFEKEFRKVVASKKSREFLFFNSDLSEPRIYHTLLFPLVNPIKGGILVGSIKRDVTEWQKNEEKIKKINLELDEFVLTVCHDLKAPLQSMIGYLDILKTLKDEKREEVRLKALSQGEMMQSFMTQLLRLSSLGRSIGSILPFDSTLIVKNVFEVFKMNYPNALLQIKGNLPVISGDINRVREVFQNIIANALENADPQKSRPIVTVSCNKESKRYVFSIKDNGKGMDAKALKRLFIIGYTTSRDNTHRFGLGLNIAKRIVEAHGGEIWAESLLGFGSSLYFSIPYKKSGSIK